jgi:peptidyl-prolyl cis-trans isomerase A (cyclophilin A)
MSIRVDRRAAMAGILALTLPAVARAAGTRTIRVRMRTAIGVMTLELYPDKAPKTVANFLRYVTSGAYAQGSFYRTVKPAIDRNPATINVIQGGLLRDPPLFPPIPIETTRETGLRHVDGTLSMARTVPGWSTPDATSEFFVCIGDNPALDFGGARAADGQGFAAFGQVTSGIEVARVIHALRPGPATEPAYWAGQLLASPVAITHARRG